MRARDGYAITVDAAELMSVREYLKRYAPGTDLPEDGYDRTDRDAPTLAVLTITLENGKSAADARGYLDSLGWSVLSKRQPHLWLRVESDLLSLSVPQIEGAFQLSVRPGTAFTVHVPFSTTMAEGFPAPLGASRRPVLDAGSYRFTATNLPVRHVFEMEL